MCALNDSMLSATEVTCAGRCVFKTEGEGMIPGDMKSVGRSCADRGRGKGRGQAAGGRRGGHTAAWRGGEGEEAIPWEVTCASALGDSLKARASFLRARVFSSTSSFTYSARRLMNGPPIHSA